MYFSFLHLSALPMPLTKGIVSYGKQEKKVGEFSKFFPIRAETLLKKGRIHVRQQSKMQLKKASF